MNLSKLWVCSLAIIALAPSLAEAQLFRRSFQRSTPVLRSNCPNGVCPTGQAVRQTVRNVVAPQSNVSRGHWSYPGTISGHLQATHGVSTVGMSHEQMLNTHDALHENRYVPNYHTSPAVPSPATVIQGSGGYYDRPQWKTPTSPLPAKTATPAKTPASSTFGLVGSSVTIPSHVLAQIAPDVSFGLETTIPEHVLAQVDTASAPVKVSESFRTSLRKAIVEARKAGKITLRDATRLRVACLSPAFLERAQELAVVQIAASGEPSDSVPLNDEGMVEVEGINWDGLAKFLEVFVPLLITLLKAFGL